jgi:hypothetical protein
MYLERNKICKIKIYEAGEQLNRIANALEEILRLVKAGSGEDGRKVYGG